MTAVDHLSAGIATGASTTDGSVAARDEGAPHTAIAHIASARVTDAPSDATAAKSAASLEQKSSTASADYHNPSVWQTNDGSTTSGYNPDIVNGNDYRGAIPLDNPCFTTYKTLHKKIAYTIVGESHAYYDAKASFTYNSTMSSSIGVMVSDDGVGWTASGSSSLDGSTGHSTGFANKGPHWAYQWKVPIEYWYVKNTVTCLHGGPYYSYDIEPHGYKVPAGGKTGSYGRNVAFADGQGRYSKSKPVNRGVIPKGTFYTNEAGSSITYGIAVSVFGIGISAHTSYNRSHLERIEAGNGSLEHDIWGARGPVSGRPGVVYSY